jgi:hypothetical protein
MSGRGPHQPDPSLGEGGEGVSACIVCYMGLLSQTLSFLGRQNRRSRTEPEARYPCRLCEYPTRVSIYNRLGGFCSERHKWEWLVVSALTSRGAVQLKRFFANQGTNSTPALVTPHAVRQRGMSPIPLCYSRTRSLRASAARSYPDCPRNSHGSSVYFRLSTKFRSPLYRVRVGIYVCEMRMCNVKNSRQ